MAEKVKNTLKNLNILICDSDISAADTLRNKISTIEKNSSVIVVSTIHSAKSSLSKESIDIIIIDPLSVGINLSTEFIFQVRSDYPKIVFLLYMDLSEAEANRSQLYRGKRHRLTHYFNLDKRTPIGSFTQEVLSTINLCKAYIAWNSESLSSNSNILENSHENSFSEKSNWTLKLKGKKDFESFLKEFFARVNEPLTRNFKTDYNSNFLDGAKKGAQVLEFLSQKNVRVEKLAFVSIGGADGSELLYMLKNSGAKYGILLEWDENWAKKIQEMNIQNATIEILAGDAWSNKNRCNRILENWFESKEITGVVFTAFSVLHELKYRSDDPLNYDHSNFFLALKGKIYPAYLYSKEPTAISEWNGKIEISMPEYCDRDLLLQFSKFLWSRYFMDTPPPSATAKGIVVDAQLAGEIAKKIVYRLIDGSVEKLIYEVQELHASILPDDFHSRIGVIFGESTMQMTTSKTFDHYFKLSGFKFRHIDPSMSNWVPNPFTIFTAYPKRQE